jgi:hypothetical protein
MSNNQEQSAKTNESTMYIKHASAHAWNFSFFLFFSFVLNKWPLKVSREYISQDFDAKDKISFYCPAHVNSSEDKYGLHD